MKVLNPVDLLDLSPAQDCCA